MTTLTQEYQALKELVTSLEDDITKSADGNKAAGGRLRSKLRGVRDKAQDIRDVSLGKTPGKAAEAT